LGIEDKYDQVNKLLNIGKEKGYLLYDEVNDMLPEQVTSPDEIEDIFNVFGNAGIEVLEGEPKTPVPEKLDFEKKFEEPSEEVELDLTPGALDKTNDPVRMYLREMGVVPLLTREGEVEIAKRIERGQLAVMKALSRTPLIVKSIMALGEDLRKGIRSIKEVTIFNDDEMTDEKVEEKQKDIQKAIDRIGKKFKESIAFRDKLGRIPKTRKAKLHRKYRWLVNRSVVDISRRIRAIEFSHSEKKRLIDKIRKTVDMLRPADREIQRLAKKLNITRNPKARREISKEIREHRAKIEQIEA